MVTNEERNRLSRAAILAAAVQAVRRTGVGGLRLDRVARDAGVNKRMLYVHFGDRTGLVQAVLDEQVRILLAASGVHADTKAFLAAFFRFEEEATDRSVATEEVQTACRILLVQLAQARSLPDNVPRAVLRDLCGWLLGADKPRLNARSVSRPVV